MGGGGKGETKSSGGGGDGGPAGVANVVVSDEDEESGNDFDGDKSIGYVQRDRQKQKVGSGGSKCGQAPTYKEKDQNYGKSNYISISQMGSPYGPDVYVGNEVTRFRTAKNVMVLEASVQRKEREGGLTGGSNGVARDELGVLGESGAQKELHFSGLLSDPAEVGNRELGLTHSDPFILGLQGEFLGSRYTSLSEPEEVLSSHRNKVPKHSSKSHKHKPGVKFNPLGVPKCVKIREAVKDVGAKAKRRRRQQEEFRGGGGISVKPEVEQPKRISCGITPPSGINLLPGSDQSKNQREKH
ncbi:hypothetical protein TSUD_229570 [Trifolium subterraneum]|uniref:Uncharacterized protein n=1 Tax=Trifolium subterraneum TaxID=3900 RepID=A0A2Z6LQN3_TRISU|nr:hypothetical protein TSUD_229570 [Trifolium subterraneum]